MNMDLDKEAVLDGEVKKSLLKYVSVRRDKSLKYKQENGAANMDTEDNQK